MGGIYVHFPFCIRKCSYCDFISYSLQKTGNLTDDYLMSVIEEMRLRSDEIEEVRPSTVYFGGGTPTCIEEDTMARFIESFEDELDRICGMRDIREFSVEANPGTVNESYLRRLRGLGVNRLSLGVQSMVDEELEAIGRIHSRKDAERSFHEARDAGFDNINLDVMFGLPKQDIETLKLTLEQVIGLRPEHVSVYSLILEEGTPLCKDVEDEKVALPDEDVVADMYDLVVDRLKKAGYMRYEVSNFALNGMECQHNLGYWDNGDYCGLGVAAHSHIRSKGLRTWNLDDVAEYTGHLRQRRLPMAGCEKRDAMGELRDTMMVGLRCAKGVDLEQVERAYGIDPRKFFECQLDKLRDMGLIEIGGTRCKLTDRGFILGNVVFREFV